MNGRGHLHGDMTLSELPPSASSTLRSVPTGQSLQHSHHDLFAQERDDENESYTRGASHERSLSRPQSLATLPPQSVGFPSPPGSAPASPRASSIIPAPATARRFPSLHLGMLTSNPPLSAACAALLVGLISPAHTAFFGRKAVLHQTLTKSFVDIGALFSALQAFGLGGKLKSNRCVECSFPASSYSADANFSHSLHPISQ